MTTAHLWAQVLLAGKGASLAGVGAALAAAQLASSAGGLLAARLRPAAGFFLWLPVGMVACWAAAATGPTARAAAAAMVPAFFLEGLFAPQVETAVQHQAPEDLRASVLSAQSALFSLAMVGLFPAFGALLQRLGPHAYLWLLPPWAALAAWGPYAARHGGAAPTAPAARPGTAGRPRTARPPDPHGR